MADTICAVATAHGIGSISVVRLSGDNALSLALKLLKRTSLSPRHATFSKIYSANGDFIDEGIIIYFKAPNSFTGEDIVEFQTHGGFIVSSIILEELLALGARLADPGEFSKRAFLNGKMDLAKAEAIQSLITSRSEDGARILSRHLQGELSDYVNTLRVELVTTLAYVETCIDYAEEDLPINILNQTEQMLDKNYEKLTTIVKISEQRKGLIEGFKVAIIGKPNVGKSSILNSLLKFERSIISDEAGTTRDRVEESLRIGSHLIRIIDTAGIREGASKVEKIGIENSIKAVNEADIIIAVFDSSRQKDEEDKKIFEICSSSNKKIILVLNKSDLPSKFEHEFSDHITICAKHSSNAIVNELQKYLDSQNYDGIMLSSNRQILSCKNAKEALFRAKNLLNENELELFAYEINLAITQISNITKPYERTEILDAMFSNFCLGK